MEMTMGKICCVSTLKCITSKAAGCLQKIHLNARPLRPAILPTLELSAVGKGSDGLY